MITVFKEGKNGLITGCVFFETRDALLEHFAKTGTDLECAAVIFRGRLIERHCKLQAGKLFKVFSANADINDEVRPAPDYADAELA